MSYNIDKWRTKKLENLVIPMGAFFIHERKDWHPKVETDSETNETILKCGCEQEIKGAIQEGSFYVSEFQFYGDGSGTFYRWILIPALEQSKGILEAVLIWEGGDSISRLTVIDGEITDKEIDL